MSEARAIMAADKGGTSDPYAVVELVADDGGKALKGESYKTKPQKKTLDPKFDESFTLGAATEDAELAAASLRVRLYDYDVVGSSDPLGEVVLPLEQFVAEDRAGFDGWRPLAACDKATAAAASLGEMRLTVRVGGAPALRAAREAVVAARAAEAAARETRARAAATRAPEQPKGLKGAGWVEVDVSEARALMAADKGGTSDPYAVVELVAGGGARRSRARRTRRRRTRRRSSPSSARASRSAPRSRTTPSSRRRRCACACSTTTAR